MSRRILAMLLAFVMMASMSISALAANETYRVAVGESVTISGYDRLWSNRDHWSINPSIANISQNDSQAMLTGTQAGTATVTHTYWVVNRKFSETFTLVVTGQPAPETVNGYFFLHKNMY